MLHRIMLFLTVFTFMVGNCYAMNFSQIVKMGSVSGNPVGGFSIEGAQQNNGGIYSRAGMNLKQWGTLYEKGVARFGNTNNALWVYYDCSNARTRQYWEAYSPNFGNKERTVTVPLEAGEGAYVQVNSIGNDAGITMYLLHSERIGKFTIRRYVVMGYDKSGKFVKYIDTHDIVNKYFGEKNVMMNGIHLDKYYCRGNTLVVEYVDPRSPYGWKASAGELRFTWDDIAQWFGVEQVAY